MKLNQQLTLKTSADKEDHALTSRLPSLSAFYISLLSVSFTLLSITEISTLTVKSVINFNYKLINHILSRIK